MTTVNPAMMVPGELYVSTMRHGIWDVANIWSMSDGELCNNIGQVNPGDVVCCLDSPTDTGRDYRAKVLCVPDGTIGWVRCGTLGNYHADGWRMVTLSLLEKA